MRARFAFRVIAIVALVTLVLVAASLAGAGSDKLPRCADVKCKDIGCPADVLCVSGGKVKTCADVCGH